MLDVQVFRRPLGQMGFRHLWLARLFAGAFLQDKTLLVTIYAGQLLDAASPGLVGTAAATSAASEAAASSSSLRRSPPGRAAWHPSRVLVRFKATASAARTAAAQQRSPLPGLRLSRLAGDHHKVPVPSQPDSTGIAGVASAAAGGSSGSGSLPSDAIFVYEVTNGTVADAVARLRSNHRECWSDGGAASLPVAYLVLFPLLHSWRS